MASDLALSLAISLPFGDDHHVDDIGSAPGSRRRRSPVTNQKLDPLPPRAILAPRG